MKKFIYGIGLIGGGVALVFAQQLYRKDAQPTHAQKTCTIAVMIPTSHPSIDQIVSAFNATINAHIKATITVFNGNRNQALMKAQTDEILDQHYDLILTVGAGTSLMMREARAQRHATIPQLFTAVDDNPVQLHLVDSLEQPGHATTGVHVVQNHAQKLAMVRYLKPTIKNVLLIYDPRQGAGLTTDRNQLKKLCEQQGLHFSDMVVTNANDIFDRASQLIAQADVVFVLIDNTVVAAMESLVCICNTLHVPLYVSDLASVDKGAALGFGIYEADSGTYAAELALKILKEHRDASTLPVKALDAFYLKANPKAMRLQNFMLDPQQAFLLTRSVPTYEGGAA